MQNGADNNAANRTMGIQSLSALLDSRRTPPARPVPILDQNSRNQQHPAFPNASLLNVNRQTGQDNADNSASGNSSTSEVIHGLAPIHLLGVNQQQPSSQVRTNSASAAMSRPSPLRTATNSSNTPGLLNNSINEFRSPKRRRIESQSPGGKLGPDAEIDEEAEVSLKELSYK